MLAISNVWLCLFFKNFTISSVNINHFLTSKVVSYTQFLHVDVLKKYDLFCLTIQVLVLILLVLNVLWPWKWLSLSFWCCGQYTHGRILYLFYHVPWHWILESWFSLSARTTDSTITFRFPKISIEVSFSIFYSSVVIRALYRPC